MGCCNSTSRRSEPTSPYDPGSGPPTAQHAVTSQAPPPTRGSAGAATPGGESTTAHTGIAGTTAAAAAGTIGGRGGRTGSEGQVSAIQDRTLRLPAPNRCRKPHEPGPLSVTRLHSERTAFWETRVTGRSEIWQVLRMVCELLQRGELVEAQAVLDAAGCVCPSGALWKGVYDERGQSYDVPAWLIGDPPNLVQDTGGVGMDDREAGTESDDEDEEEKPVSLNRAEEKGKGRAVDVGEIVKIKARLSDRATDVVVKLGQKESVKVLARRVEEQAGIAKPGRVKIVYLGKILSESDTLVGQGWREGHVVNALVFQ